jgi:ADP-ribosylglycohydrolase
MNLENYYEQIYAGVLGKIIGVYLGRPVEGWSYDAIRKTFGTVDYFVSHEVGAPLIIPDDDISGTFVFYRALEDNGSPKDITAKQIGETWLNYIIENKTILWWGGLSRSTEHSAFVQLKNGVKPPLSGSIALNGRSIAEQIGSQIFIDTWAMVNPGDPALAVEMAKKAACVSHDGIAIDAACYLAAMESIAFDEKNVDKILEKALGYVDSPQLQHLVESVIERCEKATDWRQVRDWIEENHSYAVYRGNCPMVTNHLSIIMALKMGGDDFHKSISIAASAGWDTDCNAGNVGCLNAIRLGLGSINMGPDLRGPVADRMFVVSSDGGSCVSDAVLEARKIIKVAEELRGNKPSIPEERFAFEFSGSTQGFMLHPDYAFVQTIKSLKNSLDMQGTPGLYMEYEALARGVKGAIAVQTYSDPEPKGVKDTSYFEVDASPSLYPTQTVKAVFASEQDKNPSLRFFIDYYDENGEISTIEGMPFEIAKGKTCCEWEIPDTMGRPVYKLGMQLISEERVDGVLVLRSLDWKGAPRHFRMGKSYELTPGISPFVTNTKWLSSFMSSALNFHPDYLTTFSLSHPEENGVVTIGSQDWEDYTVASRIEFVHQNSAGLVARSCGHRRYYAAVLKNGNAVIEKRKDGNIVDLASSALDYQDDAIYDVRFDVNKDRLTMYLDEKVVATTVDDEYLHGGAGFVVDTGAIVCDGFTVISN